MAGDVCICYGMAPGEHSSICPAAEVARLREQLADFCVATGSTRGEVERKGAEAIVADLLRRVRDDERRRALSAHPLAKKEENK